MHFHWFQHVPFESLNRIEKWVADRQDSLSCTRFWAGDQPPQDRGNIDGLFVLGGPMSIHDEDQFPWLSQEKAFLKDYLDEGGRVFGICLGAQLLAHVLGAAVTPSPQKEIGWFPIEAVTPEHELANLIEPQIPVLHWHGETFQTPAGATHLWRSEACENQGFCLDNRVFGLQFHLEMNDAGVGQMVRACHAELQDSSPFVMSAEQILFKREINASLEQPLQQILDRWAAAN